jgi:hypothetical protein
VAYRGFNAIVAACGSFEKSNVFGLGHRVAQQGINVEPSKFANTDLYNLNVRPFTELPLGTGSVTRALYHHPLKGMLAELDGFFAQQQEKEELKQEVLKKTLLDFEPPQTKAEVEFASSAAETSEATDEPAVEAFPESVKDDKVFSALRDKYGERQLRAFADKAGVVFYHTFEHFRKRNETHSRIRQLSKTDFARFPLKKLEASLLQAKVPQDFIDDLFVSPKRFLCPKTNYRKLVTYLDHYQDLSL